MSSSSCLKTEESFICYFKALQLNSSRLFLNAPDRYVIIGKMRKHRSSIAVSRLSSLCRLSMERSGLLTASGAPRLQSNSIALKNILDYSLDYNLHFKINVMSQHTFEKLKGLYHFWGGFGNSAESREFKTNRHIRFITITGSKMDNWGRVHVIVIYRQDRGLAVSMLRDGAAKSKYGVALKGNGGDLQPNGYRILYLP